MKFTIRASKYLYSPAAEPVHSQEFIKQQPIKGTIKWIARVWLLCCTFSFCVGHLLPALQILSFTCGAGILPVTSSGNFVNCFNSSGLSNRETEETYGADCGGRGPSRISMECCHGTETTATLTRLVTATRENCAVIYSHEYTGQAFIALCHRTQKIRESVLAVATAGDIPQLKWQLFLAQAGWDKICVKWDGSEHIRDDSMRAIHRETYKG
ncbi:hypothetical protein L1049_014011 [Liquidambar formosana]|uniref:Uncharacterized protein n=1 Tax=Liquidambar formosana TaxID=63359 RepID=A0AAP0RM93_LIQFO